MGLGERMQDFSVAPLSAEETEEALERDRRRREADRLRRAIAEGEREDADKRQKRARPPPCRREGPVRSPCLAQRVLWTSLYSAVRSISRTFGSRFSFGTSIRARQGRPNARRHRGLRMRRS